MPRNLRPPTSTPPPASASAAAANGLLTRTSPMPPEGALIGRAASLKTPPSTQNSSPPNGGVGTLVAIATMAVVFLLCVLVCATFYWRRRKRSRLEPGVALGLSHNAFTYEELQEATDGFCSLNLLGQGGFGFVHKGLLPSGKVVAIKQLKAGSQQGEREFRAEVDTISRIHHKHLVSLVGHCISGEMRILVYEYVPNGTLESHLHGKDGPTMAWPMRMKVAVGSARGLAYLHEECSPKIIHRDIKASNILLDYNFDAKVADFGLARFADTDTHVYTGVVGTIGYMDPEYASFGRLTDKADVYSFGVVLVELVTGKKALDLNRPEGQRSLALWAHPFLEQRAIQELIDPRLGNQFSEPEVRCMLMVASICIGRDPESRPRMSQVVRILEGDMLGSRSRRICEEQDSHPLLGQRALSLQTLNATWRDQTLNATWRERERARRRSYGDSMQESSSYQTTYSSFECT